MIDLASIRNASFSLTPTGYNPEEVDHFLVTLADSQPGSIDLAAVRNASFTLTPTGYNPEEVDHFLGSIADQLSSAPADDHACLLCALHELCFVDLAREPDPEVQTAPR